MEGSAAKKDTLTRKLSYPLGFTFLERPDLSQELFSPTLTPYDSLSLQTISFLYSSNHN